MIKRCPFCGERAHLGMYYERAYYEQNIPNIYVVCGGCGCRTRTFKAGEHPCVYKKRHPEGDTSDCYVEMSKGEWFCRPEKCHVTDEDLVAECVEAWNRRISEE